MTILNLIPKKTAPVIVSCSEGDQILRAFRFQFMNGDSLWNIDCDSVTMEFSNGVSIPGTVADNSAVFDCSEEMSAKPGIFFGKIEFLKNAEKIHSASFLFKVERKPA